jgi:hypothetical protein
MNLSCSKNGIIAWFSWSGSIQALNPGLHKSIPIFLASHLGISQSPLMEIHIMEWSLDPWLCRFEVSCTLPWQVGTKEFKRNHLEDVQSGATKPAKMIQNCMDLNWNPANFHDQIWIISIIWLNYNISLYTYIYIYNYNIQKQCPCETLSLIVIMALPSFRVMWPSVPSTPRFFEAHVRAL